MVDAGYYQDLLRPLFAGRKVILVGIHLASANEAVQRLRSLGADRCFVVAVGAGTGTFPSPADADWIVREERFTDAVAELHSAELLMADPPAAVTTALDRFDSTAEALVLAPGVTLGALPAFMAGRRVWGRRHPASLPLEDKVKIDAFWDSVGVKRAPSMVCPVVIDAARAASERLDRGNGTVWAGDARGGIHGGAHLLRHVRDQAGMTAAIDFFTSRCDRIRIMPFLEGIPCSIHGIVFAHHVAAVRPVELVTLRPVDAMGFLYAGAATYWDPPDADRDYMRETARRVGEAFRSVVGPGTFTIDGVMTSEGFLPTELNPRFGAGLNVMARALKELPIGLLTQALQEGEKLDYRPADLERLLVDGADSHRGGGGWTVIKQAHAGTEEHPITWDDGAYRLPRPGEAPSGSLMIGPSSVGGFLRFSPDPAQVPAGPSIAPRVAAAFALADREFGTGLGRLSAARDVRLFSS
ncbi:MAG: hypothetical protein M3077_10720 [Candidatus Dormibacteraeota bacterium]|nr:hypothetical protein [Candidatus Dormibacteraeota bacterium]